MTPSTLSTLASLPEEVKAELLNEISNAATIICGNAELIKQDSVNHRTITAMHKATLIDKVARRLVDELREILGTEKV